MRPSTTRPVGSTAPILEFFKRACPREVQVAPLSVERSTPRIDVWYTSLDVDVGIDDADAAAVVGVVADDPHPARRKRAAQNPTARRQSAR
jgi:hypothetical protein